MPQIRQAETCSECSIKCKIWNDASPKPSRHVSKTKAVMIDGLAEHLLRYRFYLMLATYDAHIDKNSLGVCRTATVYTMIVDGPLVIPSLNVFVATKVTSVYI